MARARAKMQFKSSVLSMLKAEPALFDLFQEACIEAGAYWQRKLLPKHFTQSAFALYPGAYKKRSRRYEKQKQRKKGHRDPLVYSGSMRRAIVHGALKSERRGGQRGFKVVFKPPHARVMNLWGKRRGRKSRKHDFVNSLEAMRPEEIENLWAIVTQSIERRLERLLADNRMTTKTYSA